MKKWNVMLLALALLMLPAAGLAEDLPDFLSAVYTSVGEGLEQGAMQAMAAMDQELTLEMTPSSERIEEGQSICLTIKAGNPRPKAESVKITLDLPQRLAAAPDTAWEAELPAAQIDPETGLLTPSETVFTREIALAPGGDSETAQMTAEMSMGTRFYRAKTELALCVPDVSAKAAVLDVKDGRVQPGDAFAYQVEIANAGTAAKDVDVKLLLPAGVTAAEPLPAGFTQTGNTLHGHVRAEAAGEKPGSAMLTFPVRVNENALANDADALRLLAGALHVDGKRVALPRVEVCSAKISAALMCSGDDLEAGEAAMLSVVVVNSGLAAADVKVSCVLPQGLVLQSDEKEDKDQDESADSLQARTEPDAAIPAVIAQEVTKTIENRTLAFDIHMDAAKETDGGVIANTKVLEIPVTAHVPQENLSEMLMGATLAWSVDDAPAQLGEAVALRVHSKEFLGISGDEWSGLFWASLLMLAAVVCLYAAARRDSRAEDFCCE